MFYGIQAQSTGGAWENVVEHMQAKHKKVTTTIEQWNEERNKAVQTGDFFMLFATTKVSVSKVYSRLFFLFIPERFLIFLQDQIPHRSGIVYRENFIDYFGPFAARAFRGKYR